MKYYRVYGTIELKNGQSIKWMLFVKGEDMNIAKYEAERLQCAWWKGCVVSCCTTNIEERQ